MHNLCHDLVILDLYLSRLDGWITIVDFRFLSGVLFRLFSLTSHYVLIILITVVVVDSGHYY